MLTLLLLTCAAAPSNYDAEAAAALALAKAARERPVVKADSDYEAILRRVIAGETVITDTIPGEPRGKYRCFLEGGKPVYKPQIDDGDDAPTPQKEIDRVLALLPKPAIGFVDFGCGSDARWCLAAAEHWGCRVTGVEIDPTRARAAKERVRMAGKENLVTIIEGDAITTDVAADVGVAYLWPDVLEKMKPRLEKLTAFASYMHRPPIPAQKNGDSWIYIHPQDAAMMEKPIAAAAWGGQLYTRPLCNSPNCAMCNAIRAQLAATAPQQNEGHYVKHCSNGACWYEWVPGK